MQTGEDTTVRDGARLALLESEQVEWLGASCPRGLASQMGKHMPELRDVGAFSDRSGCRRPSHLIWVFEGRHTQKQGTEAGASKVAQACL